MARPTAEKGQINPSHESTDLTESECSDALARLQITKLRYEIGRGRRLEEIKGMLAIFTVVGVIFTVYIGLSQQKQAAAYRNDDRFDRSIARLSSHEPSERLAGLAGMQQFLYTKDAERQKSSLIYLVNAASLEADPTVRSAIEDTFNGLSKHPLPQGVLNPALELARDHNLSLLHHQIEVFTQKQVESKKLLVNEHYTEVLIGDPSSAENLPLKTTGRLIASLIRAGARIPDLKGIYCVECDFNGENIDLSGVSFDNALLRRANFQGVRLDDTSFHNSDLVLTNFARASLKRANISADTMFVPFQIMAAREVGDMYASYGAIFACANLQGANFSGRLLFTLIYDDPIWGGSQRDEFYGANLDQADLSNVQFGIALPMSKFSGDTPKARIPDTLSPVLPFHLQGSTEPLHYFKDDLYRIWTVSAAADTELKSLDNYKTDAQFAFGSLHSANAWRQASLPWSFRTILADYDKNFKKPPVSYDCKTGQKSVDVSSMFDGKRMDANARF